jgi:hypothetical protein
MEDTEIMTEILKIEKKSLLKLFNINFTKLKENKKQFYIYKKIILDKWLNLSKLISTQL